MGKVLSNGKTNMEELLERTFRKSTTIFESTKAGAHHQEPAITPYSCRGVFTDWSIFSLNLSRIQIPTGTLVTNCNHKHGLMLTCQHVHVRLHYFILTEACSCTLELAYFAGKIAKNRNMVCKNAVALAYYGSCRLLVMGSCPKPWCNDSVLNLHHINDVKMVVLSQPSITWYKSANQKIGIPTECESWIIITIICNLFVLLIFRTCLSRRRASQGFLWQWSCIVEQCFPCLLLLWDSRWPSKQANGVV